MDKSWMHSDRRSKAYEFGVEAFFNFAVENLLTTTHIRCPCVKCVNLKLFGVGIIRDHLYFNGVDQSYKNWTFHGEPWEATTNASRNVEEDDGHNQAMYPGCRNYTKLSALVKLYNLKAKHGMSDVCFTELLILQGDLLPEGNTIPTSMYEAKKTLCALGLSYEKMHACPNDAHSGEYFTLRAALMWTINDFPAYGNLSGCVVKGYKACPICGDDTPSHRLKNGHKICYIGHRKWLPINHPYRRQRATFNGKLEYGTPPEPLTGEEVLHMVEYGDRVCWKKKSIFFNLEYWKYLPVRHALDVMHIEKNVCDSIIGKLLEIPGKNKDGIAARLDLLNMGVKTDLQPEYGERRTRLPPGPWNLSRAAKREVCNSFYGMKVPESYSSNIKNLVSLQDSRLLGLKSHDCHTLMQQLLPVAIRSVLEKPARYMKVLKGYVQNRTRPEGCIAERYIAEEDVEFCTEHLSDVSTVGVPSSQKWEFQSHYQVAR
ncbi:unnamed protein product [Prunus brigantina]